MTVTVADPLVIDASAFIRFHTGSEEAAAALHEAWASGSRLLAPELILPEVANALLTYTRGHRLSLADADEALAELGRTVAVWPLDLLFPGAFAIAADRGLTAYDATYVELAEGLNARLLTADRKLAASTPNAELIR
jgi:predicted nucleic acid-binding protein